MNLLLLSSASRVTSCIFCIAGRKSINSFKIEIVVVVATRLAVFGFPFRVLAAPCFCSADEDESWRRQTPIVVVPAWSFAMTSPGDGGLRVRVCNDDALQPLACDLLFVLGFGNAHFVIVAFIVLRMLAGAGACAGLPIVGTVPEDR